MLGHSTAQDSNTIYDDVSYYDVVLFNAHHVLCKLLVLPVILFPSRIAPPSLPRRKEANATEVEVDSVYVNGFNLTSYIQQSSDLASSIASVFATVQYLLVRPGYASIDPTHISCQLLFSAKPAISTTLTWHSFALPPLPPPPPPPPIHTRTTDP